MTKPRLKSAIMMKDLLSRSEGFCGRHDSITKCSNEIHRKSLRARPNMLVTHPKNIKKFDTRSLKQRIRHFFNPPSIPDDFRRAPWIVDMDYTGRCLDSRYLIFSLERDYMKDKAVLCLPAEGYEFRVDREASEEFDGQIIPMIHIDIAKDERFFLGNVTHYGIVEIK